MSLHVGADSCPDCTSKDCTVLADAEVTSNAGTKRILVYTEPLK